MKQLLLLAALIAASFTLSAQTVKIDAKGNYVAIKAEETAKPTGKTFTDTKGIVYPVMVSIHGKMFVIRTSKAGNKYNKYLKL